MKNANSRLRGNRLTSKEERNRGERILVLAAVLISLISLSASAVFADAHFTYVHVIGTGDPTPEDPHEDKPWAGITDTIAACDVGSVTDSGVMTNVCSFDGDPNSNGGVYVISSKKTRSFRREDPLPRQKVGFEKAVIPFGIPVLHPTTGDTYLTAFFDRIPGEDSGYSNRPGGRQKGVYVYDRADDVMDVIADTTIRTPPPFGDALWTDFSTNVAVSEAGAFFVGDYIRNDGTFGQGIYRYFNGELLEVVGDPASTEIPEAQTTFSGYRAVAANATTVVFVGESGDCARDAVQLCVPGVYAYDLNGRKQSQVIVSGTPVPGVDGGIFLDFAVEPKKGIFHSSIATNNAGDIVLVASYKRKDRKFQGVFMLRNSGGIYTPELILSSGVHRPNLLESRIGSFNTVAINERSEIAFVVARQKKEEPIEQGLVFYRNAGEGLRSVFKQGDTCLAELMHPDDETSSHGGLVSGSEALDSSQPPKIYFRHFYKAGDVGHSMMVLAELHEGSGHGCPSLETTR